MAVEETVMLPEANAFAPEVKPVAEALTTMPPSAGVGAGEDGLGVAGDAVGADGGEAHASKATQAADCVLNEGEGAGGGACDGVVHGDAHAVTARAALRGVITRDAKSLPSARAACAAGLDGFDGDVPRRRWSWLGPWRWRCRP